MDNIEERLWRTYTVLIGWIKFAETKASIFMTIHLALTSYFFVTLTEKTLEFEWLQFIILLFGIVFWLLTSYFLIKSLYPKDLGNATM